MDWRASLRAPSPARRAAGAGPVARATLLAAAGLLVAATAAAQPDDAPPSAAPADSVSAAPVAPRSPVRSAEWETVATVPEEAHVAPALRLRYNRVDGPAALAGVEIRDERQRRPLVRVLAGYAFSRERGLGEAEGNLPIGRRHRVVLGGSIYRRTATKDDWRVGETENTIFALVARTDYRDHYEAEGYEGRLAWRPGRDAGVAVGAVVERHRPLRTRTRVAITGKDDLFRENPAIDRGDDGVAWAEVRVGPETLAAQGGSRIVVRYERAGDPIDGDFEYVRVRAQGNWRRRVGPGQTARVRAIAASTRSGTLPLQKVYDLGGIGTLRGTPFKALHGDQFFLANAELATRARKNIDAFVFLDWGAAWFGRDDWGGARPTLDGGAGFRVGEGPLALSIARNLQRSDAPFLVRFRLGGSWE